MAASEPKNKTILVIDDDESICVFLKIVLEKEGFHVETAYNGDVGVKVVESVKVDLVILDWMMPILSGFEVLKMLQTSEHSGIPVIVITARITDQHSISVIRKEMNVVDYLNKPIQPGPFIKRVHEILGTAPTPAK